MSKSTLASKVTDRKVIGTDDYQDMEWSEIPLRMIADVSGMESFVIEGVMVARALRKGMEVDAVVYLTRPKTARKAGQISMAKAVQTIFNEWHAANRHVPVFYEGAK